MRVVLNGASHELGDGATLHDAVQASGAPSAERGVAAAIDGEVVPRTRWDHTELRDGQRVEVVRAVQGG